MFAPSTKASCSDFALLDLWEGGDRHAGDRLFERYFDALFRFFRGRVTSGVEDLVQQTLLACIEGRKRFRRDASFRTYLFQVARFQLYAHYRQRNRASLLVFEITQIADLDTSPTGQMTRKEEEQLLLEALRRIPLQYQLVLELTLWEGMTGREVAAILDMPEGTVRSRLRLATARLREEMQSIGGAAHPLAKLDDDLEAWARRIRETLG